MRRGRNGWSFSMTYRVPIMRRVTRITSRREETVKAAYQLETGEAETKM